MSTKKSTKRKIRLTVPACCVNRSANDSKPARKQNYLNLKLIPQLQKNADALLEAIFLLFNYHSKKMELNLPSCESNTIPANCLTIKSEAKGHLDSPYNIFNTKTRNFHFKPISC